MTRGYYVRGYYPQKSADQPQGPPRLAGLDKQSVINVKLVESKIGLTFKRPALLLWALTHRSVLNELNIEGPEEHNERLEFLGDAVLSLCVREFLYKQEPPMDEGRMTSLSSALVNNKALAQVGEKLGLNEQMLMSRGQKNECVVNSRAREKIVGSAVEAVIGAIYLDRGLSAAEIFCIEFIFSRFPEVACRQYGGDVKSYLQELAQEKLNLTPAYEVAREWGPDHARCFEMIVKVGKVSAGKGEGASKKDAEKNAARDALEKYFNLPVSSFS